MKKDDKLTLTINALTTIGNGHGDTAAYARSIVGKVTAPRMETVEETIYSVVFPEGYFHVFKTRFDADSSAAYGKGKVFEHVIKHQRPVEEKEPEVWEGTVERMASISGKGMVRRLPLEFIGHTVEIRLKEGE